MVKNKVAPPFNQAEFEIIFGEGISKIGEILDLGVAHNLVEKSGAWYSYQGNRLGQGRENVKNYFKDHPELAAEIEAQIRAKLLPSPVPLEAPAKDQ